LDSSTTFLAANYGGVEENDVPASSLYTLPAEIVRALQLSSFLANKPVCPPMSEHHNPQPDFWFRHFFSITSAEECCLF
jgi:hypothetical protein